ncbi:transketolase family protein [Microbacterium fluvii]|uniref:Transketolase family protein n=1 Tax=Microbacterium fluvii TaxID=415215 RepID=A0ABW2HE77_9MICO|nr:transketolase C-terminal domain-containing protein [Microbacterium fluvii]MCU4672787.1 transketolase family protein [Microbacterium fluvii]
MTLLRQPTILQDPVSFDHEGKAGYPSRSIGTILADLADDDPRIMAGSADLTWSTFLADFAERHPDRFVQAGIAERNMLGIAAGLASCGALPYVSTFSAFASLQSLDVIRNDAAYTNLPVRIIGTHTGVSMGYFGSSHHAIEDIGALRSIPNLTVLSPADHTATEALVRATVDASGPVYLRLGRGASGPDVYESQGEVVFGEAATVRRGSGVLVVATGITVHAARDAADALRAAHIAEPTVVDVHTIRPFPAEQIAALAAAHEVVVVVEDHMVDGGLGTSVITALSEHGVAVPVHRHGLRDFAIFGPPTHLYRYYGLDAAGIAVVVERAAQHPSAGPRVPLWGEADMRRELEAQQEADRVRKPEVVFE